MSLAAEPFADPAANDADTETDEAALPADTFLAQGGSVPLTFLFTDIEKSGRLWRDYPSEMDAVLHEHDELLQKTAQAWRGRVFKTMGDGAFLVFERAADALGAACDAQAAFFARETAAKNSENPLPLPVRMALHTGAAQARNGDYFGLTLNQTMRLLGAIHGRQIVLTQAAWQIMQNEVPNGVVLRPVGVHHLRDFERPEPLFQADTEAFPCPTRPLRTESLAPPHNLPRQIASFVGRETEITQIKRILFQSPLLTLTGTGGVGKTRLALCIAETLLPDFEHGAFFVDLSPLVNGALITQAACHAIGIKEEAGQSAGDALQAHLRAKSLLLVLDNCEHVIEEAAQFADDLLRACPNLHILATSREALGLWGETVRPVSPLGLPPESARTPSLAKLQAYEAVRLFVERAQGQSPAFRLTRSDAPHIVRLCRFLDGLPLALEIAASWAGMLTPEQIASRLGDRIKLLQAGGERIALPRQKTLRTVLDWSYQLLTPGEQALLRRLSVFAGGWDLEAAEAVCHEAEDAESENKEKCDVLTGLMVLVKKSLIVVDYQASTNERSAAETRLRYRMLETLKLYASQKLTETGEGGEWAKRHQAYFADFAETAEPNLRGGEQKKWLDAVEADHDNFRAALGLAGEGLPRLRIAGALGRFWLIRGHYAEGRQVLATVCDTCDNEPSGSADLRAKALNAAGYLAMASGDLEAAHTYYQRCLVLQEQAGNDAGLAIVLSNLGIIASQEKRFAAAASFYERSAVLFRAQNAPVRLANVLGNMGALYADSGKPAEAKTALLEALALQKKHNELYSVANILNNLAQVCLLEKQYDASRRYFCESLTVRRALGSKNNNMQSLCGLAALDILQQHWQRSVVFLAAAEKAQAEAGIAPKPEKDECAEHRATLQTYWGAEFADLWKAASALPFDDVINTALEAAF